MIRPDWRRPFDSATGILLADSQRKEQSMDMAEKIEALAAESEDHGDTAQAALCWEALGQGPGSPAWLDCAEAIEAGGRVTDYMAIVAQGECYRRPDKYQENAARVYAPDGARCERWSYTMTSVDCSQDLYAIVYALPEATAQDVQAAIERDLAERDCSDVQSVISRVTRVDEGGS